MSYITQRQIAGKLGLSQQAVAFALSDKPSFRGQLHPRTRNRIIEAARKMGYVPHYAARRMARARSRSVATSFDQVGLIALIPTDVEIDSTCLAMMSSAEHEFSKLHASLAFLRVSEPADWGKVDRMTRAGGVDGWLLYGQAGDDEVNRLKSGKLPFVILADHRCQQPVATVNVDNRAVGRLAVEHLASLGHRRIAFLGSTMRRVYERETLEGFRAAVAELGLDHDESLIADSAAWMKRIAETVSKHDAQYRIREFRSELSDVVMRWLRGIEPMPTAVFAPQVDWGALVHGFLRGAQIEVPQEMSLIGCEYISSDPFRQTVTHVQLPMKEVGRQGALLLHRLATGTESGRTELQLAPSLIEGWSTCPPRGHRM